MNPGLYKDLTTSRGLNYHYYHTPPQDLTLPTLLFLHGFPTTSVIWKYQVAFFRDYGFGLLVPDILGFGDSSKPTDPEMYRPSLICRDIIDILDAERLAQVVAIGHDLGSRIVSRLASFYDERFLGYGFLAVPYCAPRPQSTMEGTLKVTKRMCGYELFGHILFLADDPEELVESHLDSFHSAMFPYDPKMWVTDVAPIGALKAWLEADKKTPLPPYLTEQDVQVWRDTFMKNGFSAPSCWYKARASGINADDDRAIPLDQYKLAKSVFFGGARHDYIARSVIGIAATSHHCSNAVVREFNTGHWLMMSAPTEVNGALLSWIMDIV